MRSILLSLFAALLVGWLLWKNDPVLPPGLLDEAEGPGAPRYHFEGLVMQRTDATGQPAVQLTVARAEYFDNRAARLVDINAKGLSGAAAPWSLHSALGEVAGGERRLKLNAPVSGTGRFPDGEPVAVAAGSVWVEEGQRRLVSTEPVMLTGSSRAAKAKGFVASFDGKSLKLNNVEMRYALRR